MTAILTAGDAMLREIIEHPDSRDDVRLIYADWLEERGEADRAELIRVQIAIEDATKGCGCGRCVKRRGGGQHHNGSCNADRLRWPDDRGRLTLQARALEMALLTGRYYDPPSGYTTPGNRVHGRYAWAGAPLASLPDPDHKGWTFRRGFVETVRLPLAAWQQWGPALVASHPLTRVELSDREPARSKRMAIPGANVQPFGWWFPRRPAQNPQREDLPRRLMRFLPEVYAEPLLGGIWYWYDTMESALDALSVTLIDSVKPLAIH